MRPQWTGIEREDGNGSHFPIYRAVAIFAGMLYADSWRDSLEAAEQDELALRDLGVSGRVPVGTAPNHE